MALSRTGHGAFRLASGKVLIVGGASDADDDTITELYDPVAGTFTAGGSLGRQPPFPPGPLLASGQLSVLGRLPARLEVRQERSHPARAEIRVAPSLRPRVDPPRGGVAPAPGGRRSRLVTDGRVVVESDGRSLRVRTHGEKCRKSASGNLRDRIGLLRRGEMIDAMRSPTPGRELAARAEAAATRQIAPPDARDRGIDHLASSA